MDRSPPKIFNVQALTLAKTRSAKRQTRKGLSFLLQRGGEDAASRLEDINRQFTRAALICAADMRPVITSNLRAERIPTEFEHINTAADLRGEYDLILSLFELQSDDAIPETLMRCRKHLAPDGLLLIGFLGGDTLTELRQSLYAADQQILGGATARIFPMVDYSQAAMLLGRVGLALPVVDMDRLTVHYSELSSLVSDLRDLGLTNTLAARETRPLTRRWREALQASYKTHFARGDGKLKASFEIVWMTGWAPHGSQQKPLKPGSAKMRLADALKTKETKI